MLRKDLQTITMNVGELKEYTAEKAAKDAAADGTVSSDKKPRAGSKRSKDANPRQEKMVALNKTSLDHQIRQLHNRILELNERTVLELAKAESCGILEVIQPTSSTTRQFDSV
ncbi:uncharacterized protein LOC126581015 [Anopheles aquasalis]|uniref:uncharacterized protein LOC126581015 n=1 Tax=Anopheles aquasalis TaxID=42839 RepID=UPI00215A19A1|nr:uncharacterized protein LOC126581015 [Anopheles aquasalis]